MDDDDENFDWNDKGIIFQQIECDWRFRGADRIYYEFFEQNARIFFMFF